MKAMYVVDDAVDYRFLVQQVFTRFLPQYPLVLLPDGQALVDHLTQLAATDPLPGLIVLDMDMKMSGIETLSWLKQQPDWRAVPVVMMSNRSDAGFSAASYQRGACDYVDKPMDIAGLRGAFDRLGQQWLIILVLACLRAGLA